MAEIYVVDRNIPKIPLDIFQTYINTIAPTSPIGITPKGNGYLVQFYNDEQSNFIFNQQVISYLMNKNMMASLSKDTQMAREIFIPNPPAYIFAMTEDMLVKEIQQKNNLYIIDIRKFTSFKTGRNYIILTPLTKEIAKRTVANAKIIIDNQEIAVEARKFGKHVNGTQMSRQLPPNYRTYPQHQGHKALNNQWTPQQYQQSQSQVQANHTSISTPPALSMAQNGVPLQHNPIAQSGYLSSGFTQMRHTSTNTPTAFSMAQVGLPQQSNSITQTGCAPARFTQLGHTSNSTSLAFRLAQGGVPHQQISTTSSTQNGNSTPVTSNIGMVPPTMQGGSVPPHHHFSSNAPTQSGTTTVPTQHGPPHLNPSPIHPGASQYTAPTAPTLANSYGSLGTSNAGSTHGTAYVTSHIRLLHPLVSINQDMYFLIRMKLLNSSQKALVTCVNVYLVALNMQTLMLETTTSY